MRVPIKAPTYYYIYKFERILALTVKKKQDSNLALNKLTYVKNKQQINISVKRKEIRQGQTPSSEFERNEPRISFKRNMKGLVDGRVKVDGFGALLILNIASSSRKRSHPTEGQTHSSANVPQSRCHLYFSFCKQRPFFFACASQI